MKKYLYVLLLSVSSYSYGSNFSVEFNPADNSVKASTIQSNSITGDKIAPLAVDDSKISSVDSSKVIGLNDSLNQAVPVGSVLTMATINCPAGYLKADGSLIDKTEYSALYAVMGNIHGTSGNSFNLPDYRGRFLRMVDETANRDPNKGSRTAMNSGGNSGNLVGSVQSDAFQGHKHGGIPNTYMAQPGVTNSVHNELWQNGDKDSGVPVSDGVNGTPRTSSETRPINAYVLYCIKY